MLCVRSNQKDKVPNRGELPQYYMADCHEAIIDRDTYAKVKAEMERRASLLNPTYCFTKKSAAVPAERSSPARKEKSEARPMYIGFAGARRKPG